jgi:hypothetical protein
MTKRKKAVVIYAHCDNYLTNLENFDSLLTFNGLVIYPQKEFEKLYNMKDDKNVFVVPLKEFEDCDLGYIHLEDVLKHPQTVPFIGSKERAEALIELLGRKKIKGISIWPPTDLYEQPSGSYLTLRSQNSLEAEYSLNESGRFIGIPKKNI